MPAKRCPTWYSKDLPQCLQNWLYNHQYSEVEDVTVGEGIVERVISRNTIIITLKDDSEVQIRLFKVSNKNEPYCWEAKQALHQMLTNQKVYFISLGEEPPNTLLADVHLPSGQSATEMLIKYGLASLQHCPELPKKEFKYLTEVENKAKTEKRGIWSLDHKNLSLEKFYINKLLFKQIKCVVYKIENVDSIQMVTTPDNFCIDVAILRSPNVNAKKQNMIARRCLLYKCVNVELQNYDICANRFTGRITHPQLAELSNTLRQNKKLHKKNGVQSSTFTASVIEVFNGNSFTLRFRKRVIKNVFLSYIMFPWQCGDMKHLCCEKIQNLKLVSMYYTHRLRLNTREILRALLVGSSVQVTVDYLDGSKGIYCTMKKLKKNIAKMLIEEGYAYADIDHSVCPYREEYLAAESKAKECEVGMHASFQQLHIDVAWCMDNVLQLLSILKDKQRVIVVVEQVLSPSYIILFSVELGWLFAFSLIDFEEVRRANTGISKRDWKETVTRKIAEMCLQKEVSFQATSVDSNGVIHGNLKMGTWNLRKLLLRNTGNRTSVCCNLRPRWHCNTVLDVRRKRVTRKYFRYISGRHDAAVMQRIKQNLRREVKTFTSMSVSSSPYFISNRKKKKRMTMQCHIEQHYRNLMPVKPDNMAEKKKNIRKVRGRKNQKKRELQEASINQQTGRQYIIRMKRTMQLEHPKKNEQIKDDVVQTKTTTVSQQENEVFKKWKEVKNKVTLRWCCF